MPNPAHVERLKTGVEAWNTWRASAPDEPPDLRDANLQGLNLKRFDLTFANLEGANLHRAQLREANLADATLRGAYLRNASLPSARLMRARMRGANLTKAYLRGADLTGAELVNVDFSRAVLVDARLHGADLSMARVYGTSVWDVQVDDSTTQRDLVITRADQPALTVDDLEVAQFIYLLLHNARIRRVIDTITSKVVLILGNFREDRKRVLEAIRDDLRRRDYVPILFDFDRPRSKDLTGTVETLARMARFIIADVTDPRSVPHELATLIPHLRTTPVALIRLKGADGYILSEDYKAYPWVLPEYEYESEDSLIGSLERVVGPADDKAQQMQRRAETVS
jgi:Pentapeptide repeats (8 copies)